MDEVLHTKIETTNLGVLLFFFSFSLFKLYSVRLAALGDSMHIGWLNLIVGLWRVAICGQLGILLFF
jgi:hypothetical protein